ncbi:MAG: type II toxin-antitoxin system RelE/ParE family toxin [Bacteroidota bacterium]|jgi:hypothetical protein|nr:type II toxin-antitoxin system RelE/ParE family toxin [Ignavibacteria bacterium]MCU7513785.1 type II toxin-antitoxin system RelE/ParE family toxin [Ignavibacteria bacterium]
MNKYRVIAYEDHEGYSEVDAFIESRKERDQVKIYSFIDKLEADGPQLPRPYADLLRDGIHELRVKLSGKQTRTLYFFCYGNYIVLSHTFVKNTDKVPDEEIDKAIAHREDFCQRFTRQKLDKQYEA